MLARLKFEIKPLVKEILNQVDPGVFESSATSFLDPAMGGGQFIFETIGRLKEQGHSHANIKSRVFGYESNILYVNYVKERYFREYGEEIPATLLAGGLKELEILMKQFDLVMGNPPYQDPGKNQANKIWVHFAKEASNLLKPEGVLLFITPQTWLNPSDDIAGFSILKDLFATKQLITAHTESSLSSSFPGVGSSFSWWMIKNTPYQCPSAIITDHGILNLDLRTQRALPKSMHPLAFSIVEKMKKEPFPNWHPQEECSKSVREKTEEYDIPCFHTPANGGTFWYAKDDHPYFHHPKVLVSLSGKYAPRYSDNEGYTSMCIALFVDSREEGLNAEGVLKSKLYRWFVGEFKHGGFNNIKAIMMVPAVDLTRTWTDSELYEHFGLTEEEKQYVTSS